MRPPAQHGTRSRYTLGCRCQACRKIALAYARTYYRRTRKLRKVSSAAARAHILELAGYGLGINAIADSCGVGPATVRLIRSGRKQRIYSRTEQRIFSVTPEGIADGARVDAAVTRSLLRELLEEGWSRRDINRALGRKGRNLHVLYQNQVTAATEMRVERLYRRALQAGQSAIPERAA